ncbi:hypothetical protein DL96DRAFT_1825828 [Flagelloscypha sp. PMI_526]|nr:hypothetical protein DL96DRAFT_1825828 [Flagelloscypha sp. PMI_526]
MFPGLFSTKKLLAIFTSDPGVNERTRTMVSLPAELWVQILLLLDSAELWQLRFLCSVFREMALESMFRTLDLSLFSKGCLDTTWNNWEPQFNWLTNWLNWIEQPYISRRVRSVVITPHLEYILAHRVPIPNTPPQRLGGIWNIFRSLEPPNYKEDIEIVPRLTSRVLFLCHNHLPLPQITSLTIVPHDGSYFSGKPLIPPHHICECLTFLLWGLSPYLRTLTVDLNGDPYDLCPCLVVKRPTATFPRLDTFAMDIQIGTLKFLPYIQQILSQSPRFQTAKFTFRRVSRQSTAPVPTPLGINGRSITTVRVLDVCLDAREFDFDSEILLDLLPILPQIEEFTLHNSTKYARMYVRHLTPKILRRLVIKVPDNLFIYTDIFERFGGANSALTELIVDVPRAELQRVTMNLPILPCLLRLSLCAFCWDIPLLARLPKSAPGLKWLSLQSRIIILQRDPSRFVDIGSAEEFSPEVASTIEEINCELWKEWGLENIELLTPDHKICLILAMKAFARKLQDCRAVCKGCE